MFIRFYNFIFTGLLFYIILYVCYMFDLIFDLGLSKKKVGITKPCENKLIHMHS